MRIGSTRKSTAIRLCLARAPRPKKQNPRARQELAQPCALKNNSLAAPFVALKLSTASAFSPSPNHLTVIILFWAVAPATKKVGARAWDLGNIFRDYLWAAPCLVVLKLSTASASSPNAFRPWATLFLQGGDHSYLARIGDLETSVTGFQ